MKSSALFTRTAAGALALGLSTAAFADTWRYAHEEYEGDVQDVYAVAFKEYIEANSDHTLEIYRFGELGESDDIMEQAQSGILEFVNQSPGFSGAWLPPAQIFFVPYLLPTDEQTVLEFFNESEAINEMFPELYAEHDLELLKMYPEGEMVVTADEPITSPEDLNNKKIRVMTNPLLSETYDAFGASPTPLPWGEVYGGLQTGVIDGQENPIFWIESGGLYEVSPNLTFTGHGWFVTASMANQDFFEGLSDSEQQMIREAANVAYDHTMEHIQGLADESLEKIREDSDEVTVTRLTDEQIEAFKAQAPQVEQAYLEMTGEDGEALLEQFKADLEEVQSN
ncbi:C4-dicarboxylate ABC transporter [Spiribacter aquaticus]|jgi:TRAP-type C4-dicarboxylate transport system substrate-binding protein|uniref:C4-dicarboxylate ABC transporter n=1 Tax=Spiribacter aquaticus TaxID=1935996 RepID=A0A557RNH9_9GAMM|nr:MULTISPECIES: TRAP transporter substrate-binding protein DctP [Spiribacter]KAF0279705.1 C4-dicarboxylate ABC transporter [Spiribacter roseus]KAF0282128.1 C4-dicarboxylate ABC transporter [Spiribacter roseus]TVO66678.1 C4-dicarboxylate ABC transporter [Spiribacter aquaticus]